ncbi:uncharacterized protein LOC141720249 [Apium graveolens]|uniref:uncharacterized protein LOC141720249 n=1 Tax=Apium graveolens TaxID=4045 RepID=UPI003D7983C7
MMKKLPGCSDSDSPDIISRVFHLKLEQLLDDIKTKHYFGVCIGVMYVVEFHKHGLLHVHLLIWLNSESKKNLTNNADKYVSAELSDPETDHVGYAVVQSFIIHGPCRIDNLKCVCMKEFKCTKHFPKNFPIYKRRKTSITVSKGKCNLDNQWVVPYSRDLLVKYQCHMNVEICCHARSLKYLFKYCLKGHDRVTVEITGQNGGNTEKSDEAVDEINEYFDGRYICASEAANRIFSFPIHHRSKSVHRLSFHFPGERSCTFREQECLEKVVNREKYFHRYGHHNKRGKQTSRLLYTHHSAGELWFLRLLLSKNFQDACRHYGLLDDDNEWHEVLSDATKSGFPVQIRHLFVHIIVNCQVTDIQHLWNEHWKNVIDHISLVRRDRSGEMDKLLRCIVKSLEYFKQLPIPPRSYLQTGLNNLVIDETSYNMSEMVAEFDKLFPKCYPEQLQIYNVVSQSVKENDGGLFFAYGSGGFGKTFLWKTFIYKLRSMGLIVLPVASSGIVATLLPGGQTAHSRFKISIILDDYSSCGIGHDSDIAGLIKCTSLIIWDEASMQHRYAFEFLDRSLRDIMRSVHPSKYELPFRGITVLLGGDFRQILHVISLGSHGDIVSACITRSYLWRIAQIYLLKKNMRLNQGQSEEEVVSLKNFVDWVLDIGNGKVSPPLNGRYEVAEDDIIVPAQFCDPEMKNDVRNMIQWTYPDFLNMYKSPRYLSERAILTPTNQVVTHLNSAIVDTIPGEYISYFSVDRAKDFGGIVSDLSFAFPPEYLNSINIPGLPPNELKLKEGVVVMLMRNLNQTLGLCNGTRMMVTRCFKLFVECEVICGASVGTKHFIPRMKLIPTETKLPFKLIWKQMPLQICYSMTINKSQGQSLERVGLFLPNLVFTHGQLYVAFNRVTSPDGLKVFIDSPTGASTNLTCIVVFKEVFYNLPAI